MKVEKAEPLVRGIDTVMTLGAKECKWLVQNQFDFVVRYLYGKWAVTPEEVQQILCSGLALMLVTPSRLPGWTPSWRKGNEDGIRAVDSLDNLKIPRGETVYIDLEGCDGPEHETSEWIDWVSFEIVQAGYKGGLYVGVNPGGMTSESLWLRPHITTYWRSGSNVPAPANRGWSMQQLRPLDVYMGPLKVDVNVIEKDLKNEVPTWVVR